MVELAKLIRVPSQDQFELLEIYFGLPTQRLGQKKNYSTKEQHKGRRTEDTRKKSHKKSSAFCTKTHEQATENVEKIESVELEEREILYSPHPAP